MRQFFALPALLPVAVASRTFSVLEDLLAFPQYSVAISDTYLTEAHASAIFNGEITLSEDFHTDSDATETSENEEPQTSYEELVLDGQRYLCSIPHVSPPTPANDTEKATEDTEEAALELARATNRGWELLKGMQGNCIYFFGGWWSYSFCFNEGVKQFHQLPPGRNAPVWPPAEDKAVDSYILGRYVRPDDKAQEKDDHVDTEEQRSSGVEVGLETKGETRYLVQKLNGGTLCDLTGKERRIEVQVFHSQPSMLFRLHLRHISNTHI